MISLVLYGCGADIPQETRVKARVVSPTIAIEPGEQPLGLGGYALVNRSILWRDGTLYIPGIARSGKALPLLVWLHGGGGNADSFKFMFPLAEKLGVVILALDARHNTWDGIDSPFGPDVRFIDAALRHTFERVAIDPQKIALGGISDGASYALAIGRANGDLFTHIIASAPGRLEPPSPPVGRPEILVTHGTRDNVYSVQGSRYVIVPRLKTAGYDVSYFEFDGPHWVPAPVAEKMLTWLAHGRTILPQKKK